MAFDVSRGIGFILFATTNGGFLLSHVSRIIFNHFAGVETGLYIPPQVRSGCDLCVADYVGRYTAASGSPEERTMTIVETRGMLSTGRRQYREFCLWPIEDEAFLNRATGAIFTFRRDGYGKVHQVEVTNRGTGTLLYVNSIVKCKDASPFLQILGRKVERTSSTVPEVTVPSDRP